MYSNNDTAVHGGPLGMDFWGERIVTGTFSEIRFFDKSLKEISRFSHPHLCGVHGLSVYGDRLWVSSCSNDCILCFTKNGELIEEIFLSENPALMEFVKKPIRRVNKDYDFRRTMIPIEEQIFHVNYVQETEAGVFLSLHKQGVLWNISEDKPVVHSKGREIHDACLANNLYFINDTGNCELKVFNKNTDLLSVVKVDILDHLSADEQKSIRVPFTQKISNRLHKLPFLNKLIAERSCRLNWLRGLCVLDDSHVLLGISPASILRVNIKTRQVEKCFMLNNNLCSSVFSIIAE